MKDPIIIKHFANIGDIVASLAGVRGYYEKTGRKTIYCQQLNVLATYYEGAVHPIHDDAGGGRNVMCNQKMFEMIRPLLLSQEYIEDMQVFDGQKVGIDFDIIRGKLFINMPHQALQQWLFMAYPDIAYDLSKAWIYINEADVDISDCKLIGAGFSHTEYPLKNLHEKIIVNFTERYRNHAINYFFLKEYGNNVIFSGTEGEHKLFCSKWKLELPYLKVTNFLQLVSIVKQSKFILGNQSFIWNTAEAMKTPRIVELCQYAPNCQAFIGEDSFGFLHQTGLEYYVSHLFNKNKKIE